MRLLLSAFSVIRPNSPRIISAHLWPGIEKGRKHDRGGEGLGEGVRGGDRGRRLGSGYCSHLNHG